MTVYLDQDQHSRKLGPELSRSLMFSVKVHVVHHRTLKVAKVQDCFQRPTGAQDAK